MSHALFISKQPVLDIDDNIHDYIFYYAPYEQMQQNNHTKAFIDALFQTGLKSLREGRHAFIKINREMLLDPSVFSFPNEQLILGIDNAEPIDDDIIRRVSELKALNFKFAIFHTSPKEEFITEITPLLPFVDYLIVDANAIDPDTFKTDLKKLQRHPLTMISSNLSDEKSRRAFITLGFERFSGHYFLDTPIDDEKEIAKGYQETLKLLNVLETNEAIDEIAAEFATYPHITLQLLRYLNSPAFALQRTIKSIRHALLLIGRQELRRWLLLLAFAQTGDSDTIGSPLLYTAKIRMSLMRFLVNRLEDAPRSLADEAPFVAVLSLLRPLIGVSYEKLFESLSLDEKIKGAIVSYEGTLGKLLELTIATEQSDKERVAVLLEELDLEPEAFQQALLESYDEHQ